MCGLSSKAVVIVESAAKPHSDANVGVLVRNSTVFDSEYEESLYKYVLQLTQRYIRKYFS